jgi:prepilin-type N-terminal cleavage/methylation domain-containing protein
MSLRSERGFTLIELMLVMSLALVILGATLTSFTAFERRTKQTNILNDSAQVARSSMDHAARQLRNLANQDPSQQTTTIARALPFDLVFQTSDPSRKWVRYCLDTTGAGGVPASPPRGRLWESQTATGAAPTAAMLGDCPGTGWVLTRLAADHLMNRNGPDRPVFTYACGPAAAPGCPTLVSNVDYPRIRNVNAQLVVDPNPTSAPPELRVVSSIFLRNQNEKPIAAFTSSPVAGQARTVILNASSSTDPEGRTLAYDWFLGNGAISLTPEEACAPEIKQKENLPSLKYLGQGVTYRYTVPATVASPMKIRLVVRDPGCLYDTTVQDVTIP